MNNEEINISLKCSKNMEKTKYILKKIPIGKGSFSTVYHATDSQKNEYAIKKIKLDKLEPERLAKFMQELDISIQMNHENIVKCNEIFKTDRHWYIVNEYCNYGTFSDLISALIEVNTKQRENLCHYYLNQLKNALYYLNINNIIHRDLKPQNILLTKEKNKNNEVIVKLADFGFSRYFNKQQTSLNNCDDMEATICGTPMYMAPELLIDGKYNKRADLWSYGVIMYELLYGKNPYNYPKNITHLMHLIKQQKINYCDGFSNDCTTLIKSLLAINPNDRITWDDFFDHKWFKNIPFPNELNFSEKLEKSTDTFEQMKNSQSVIDFDYVEKYFGEANQLTVITDVSVPPIGKPIKSSDKLDDFIIVEKQKDGTEIASPKKPNIQSYKEITTSTIIQIMFDSVGYLLGQTKNY